MEIYWPDYVESSCRQNHSYLDSSDFMITAYHCTALFTIPLSIFTFLTIIRVTPRKMKNMKVPLLIAHAWGTNLDLLLTVNLTPVMYYPTASGTPRGLFGALGIPVKWCAYVAQVSIIMIGVNFVMLLENRHSQISWIKFKITRLKTRIFYFGVNYFLAFFLMLAFYMEDADQMELREFVLKRIPCPTIDFYDKNTYVLLKGGEILPFLAITIGLLIVIIQSLFFLIHTIYYLNYVKQANISESTRALQRKFLGYVAMQVTIPWTSLVCPILYSLYADSNQYYNQAFNNISMVFMASHGLTSTVCTLFIIKPYREFVKNLFKGNKEYDPKNMWASMAPTSMAPTKFEKSERIASVGSVSG
ncbi:hypothetical protein B9Z55_018179 [Caenorhabditis nigoni]|uniref:G-protein coupled receptors family 1 profile domain-containing protein n=1 Tax=Caenorhabditis nigoni TaxID=1611254 RepID=A0A2G5TCY6_9PELO|nr:hypothetical protein B9Z55_018179 [Caenorhabditis nigoni]